MADKSSEEQLLEFLYACPVGLIECSAAGDIVMVNPHAMQHLLPLAGTRDTSNLFTAFEQHAPELRSIVSGFGPATGRICDGHRIAVDLGRGRRNGPPMVLACTLVKLGPDRLMVTLTDVTQQIVQEERLRQADAWFATLLDSVNDYAALTITPDGKVETVNTRFTRQTGYDHAQLSGRDLGDVLGEDEQGGEMRLDEQLCIAARDGWHLQEGWQRRAEGSRYWCQRLVVARSEDDDHRPSGFSVVLRDVPRRKAGTEEMRRLLTCDHLTGAANRRHFGQVLEREQSRWQETGQSLSLIALDLDYFKAVNDTYGHPMGDTLLCRVAEACAALLPIRGLFARLGGEEFGVLLPRHDRQEAIRVAEEMRKAIAAIELDTPRGPLRATASFGYASLKESKGSTDTMMALADERLYAAKRAGRDQVYRLRAHAA